jgi:uncharacterized protein (DUF1501 family)
MLINPGASRRQFLSSATKLAAAGVVAPLSLDLFGLSAASAQTATDYKAIVCFYIGSSDHFDTLVPYDTSSYNSYATYRRGLAVARTGLLPISGSNPQGGREAALNGNLVQLKGMYDAGRAAIVASTGNLIVPLTKNRVNIDTTPSQLGSHVDQWYQNASSRSGGRDRGWVGLMGDVLATGNTNPGFSAISMMGYSRHLDTPRSYFTAGPFGQPSSFIDPGTGLDSALTSPVNSNNLFERALANVNRQSRDLPRILDGTLPPEGNFAGVDLQNEMMVQMRSVARHVAASSALGMKRQVFFVQSLDPTDTHNNHFNDHARTMGRMDAALGYLDTALGTIGMRDKVTTFVTGEFGRCLVANGDGTDHGWGRHTIITGGAVNRADIYGTLPNMDRNGPDLLDDSAPLLPTTGDIQVAATLGKWLGVSDSDLNLILPDLGAFASRDLGFLRA